MADKEIIELLAKQNERLMQIIEQFAGKEQNVHVVVNSYNGSNAEATSGKDVLHGNRNTLDSTFDNSPLTHGNDA